VPTHLPTRLFGKIRWKSVRRFNPVLPQVRGGPASCIPKPHRPLLLRAHELNHRFNHSSVCSSNFFSLPSSCHSIDSFRLLPLRGIWPGRLRYMLFLFSISFPCSVDLFDWFFLVWVWFDWCLRSNQLHFFFIYRFLCIRHLAFNSHSVLLYREEWVVACSLWCF
jgi:hypothetical protein